MCYECDILHMKLITGEYSMTLNIILFTLQFGSAHNIKLCRPNNSKDLVLSIPEVSFLYNCPTALLIVSLS